MKRLLILVVGLSLAFGLHTTSALSGSEFRAGRIMDDAVFFNGSTLDTATIQTFLNSKVPNCDTNHSRSSSPNDSGPPYTCLKGYSQDTPTKSAESGLCDQYSGGYKSAAEIIHAVGQACGVSQKVLLVLLEKEQGLVTDSWPWSIQYRSATGYGCPDTAPCDTEYYGFFNQVYNAARQFKRYGRDSALFRYRAFRDNYIQYNPSSACGETNVYIENQATAGLYNYTPYQPNLSALTNLYGSGDSCASYGNRNFWRFYNDWFGSTLFKYSVNIVPYSYATNEAGRYAQAGVSLTGKPAVPVEVRFISSSPNEGSPANSTVTIYPSTWNDPTKNILTINGRDDALADGSVRYTVSIDSVGSLDPAFDKMPVQYTPTISLINGDNEDTSIYRLFNHSTGRHYFTAVKTERDYALQNGYSSEGTGFNTCSGDSFDIIRLENQSTGSNRLTASLSEISSAQQNSLVPSVAFSSSMSGNLPVYRLHNNNGDYFYTTSSSERQTAQQYGYQYEGVSFFACAADDVGVYRLYRSNTGSHFYTTDISERNAAQGSGYQFEKVAFYIK